MDYGIIFGKNKIRGLDTVPSDIEVIPADQIEEIEEEQIGDPKEEGPEADIEEAEELKEDPKTDSSSKEDDDFWEVLFSEDVIEILDAGRSFLHPFYYEAINPIHKHKEEFDYLFTLEERSKEDELRLKELYSIIKTHESDFKDFRDKIPYSEKQRKRISKVFKKILSRMEGSGNIPLWFELLIVFVLPELIILATAFIHKFSK